LFFFLAIIPASEYSTLEHVLQIHNNHSKQLSLENYDEYESPVYTHVENMKTGASILPFTIGNATNVKCSPRFSLRKLRAPRGQKIFFSRALKLIEIFTEYVSDLG